ncbi:MAG: methyltransferase domain-containing protein [Candidatus Lokiarchaeota archaeon]|nr:methyltransferase domain-containing protein [Candidatus Lokiarchaeota archaeon]
MNTMKKNPIIHLLSNTFNKILSIFNKFYYYYILGANFSYIIKKAIYNFGCIPFLGQGYYCPICEKHFRKFIEFSSSQHKFIICPRDGSRKRQRLIWLFLKKYTKLFKNSLKLLYVAPVYCFDTRFKKMKNIDYYSIDLFSSNAMYKMDLTKLKFKSKSFDAVICNHVLEHIEDDILAIKEIYRVLKIDGWALITVPIDIGLEKTFENKKIQTAQERLLFYGQKDHLRLYGKDFRERLDIVGFNVSQINFSEKLNNQSLSQCGLNEEEIIFYCKKNQ